MNEHLFGTRRLFLGSMGLIGSWGCCPKVRGSRELLSRLADYSRQTRVGISLLGAETVYIQYLFDPINRQDISLPHELTHGKPAILVDWGRAIVIQENRSLRVAELSGGTIGEVERTVSVDACVLCRQSHQLLFSGWPFRSGQYVFCLADLAQGKIQTLMRFERSASDPRPNTSAYFTGADSLELGISYGFENYWIRSASAIVLRKPWQIEFAEPSPDGKTLVGRGRRGRVVLLNSETGRTVETDILSLGRSRWDPTSRYIFAVRRVRSGPWCAQTEMVILDSVTQEQAFLTPISPDDRDHPYGWTLF
jgi:hypothetical protein